MTRRFSNYPQARNPGHSSFIQRDNERDHVVLVLEGELEAIARDELGEPNRSCSNRSVLRWGRKGSVALHVRGPRRGLFSNHEAGIHGGVLDLIMLARGCGFAAALDHGRALAGLGDRREPDADELRIIAARRQERAARDAAAAAEDESRAEYARRLWREALPIQPGSTAARYLEDARSLPVPADGWPAGLIRFDPRRRAIVVPLTLPTGTLPAVQLIHLGATGQKATPLELDALGLKKRPPVKQSIGKLAGTAWRLPATVPVAPVAGNMVAVCEGPETALAVWVATGCRTFAKIGTVRGDMTLPPGSHVLICRDDDPLRNVRGQHSQSIKASKTFEKRLRMAGHRVMVVYPWSERRGDKSDLADTITAGGVDAVRARFRAAIAPDHKGPRGLPVADVRRLGAEATASFMVQADTWNARHPNGWAAAVDAERRSAELEARMPTTIELPPASLIRQTVGTGKSHAARANVIARPLASPAAGSRAPVNFFTPTLALADEGAAKLRDEAAAAGAVLRVEVWRGREAADPNRPDHSMCDQPSNVLKAMTDARLSIGDNLCPTCPFAAECGHQKQRKASADVWFMANSMLFSQRPKTMGTPGLILIDEDMIGSGLYGVTGKPTGTTIAAILADQMPAESSRMMRDRLRWGRMRLADLAAGHGEGPIRRDALAAHDLADPATANELANLEQARADRMELDPDALMDPARRNDQVRILADRKLAASLASIYRGIATLAAIDGPEASGNLEIGEGTNGLAVMMKGRRDIHRSWKAPTLFLDATGSIELLRHYVPNVKLAADLVADAPHQHVVQVIDRSWSMSSLRDGRGSIKPKQLRDIRAILSREMRVAGTRSALMIGQLAVQKAIEAGGVPDGVSLAHFNAVAGIDQWRDVGLLMIVGRTAARPIAVERLAEALTGRGVTRIAHNETTANWYPAMDRVRVLADGTTQSAAGDFHPDHTCEAIRQRITESELAQAIGRARGVNRTGASPVRIVVLTDVALPGLPLAETATAGEMKASPLDLMAAAGGVALENAAHAARAFPAIWSNAEAARKAFQRDAEDRDKAIIGSHTRNVPVLSGLIEARYQLTGAGQKLARVWFDPAVVADPAAWLAARVGALAAFEIVAAPEPAEEAAERVQATAKACPEPAEEPEARITIDEDWTPPPDPEPSPLQGALN